ncbi:unnamed protein product [Ectocarpus sp. 8 AP-2014]
MKRPWCINTCFVRDALDRPVLPRASILVQDCHEPVPVGCRVLHSLSLCQMIVRFPLPHVNGSGTSWTVLVGGREQEMLFPWPSSTLNVLLHPLVFVFSSQVLPSAVS